MDITPESLAHCASEPIAFPEHVQPFGGLLVLETATGTIVRHSTGAAHLLDSPALLGSRLDEWIALEGTNLDECLLRTSGLPTRLRGTTWQKRPLSLILHKEPTGGRLLVELLPTLEGLQLVQEESLLLANLSQAIEGLRQSVDLNAFWGASSELLQGVLGYERVLIYRFESDGSGTVIAEATSAGLAQRFVGLRFPESDIPAQARAMYERNLIRVIADVDAVPHPLVGSGAPVDQSLCLLRQPSPMHLQYLRNMGVRATLTVSLLQQGKLWGMLACHHSVPREPPHHLNQTLLVACNLLGATFNNHLEMLLRLEQSQSESRLRADLAVFRQRFEQADGEVECMELIQDIVGRHLPLANCVLTQDCSRACDSQTGPPDMGSNWALLCLPLSEGAPSGCLRLTKTPQTSEWAWAGNPQAHEPVAGPDGGMVLGPRRSFELWRQTAAPVSEPWTPTERALILLLGSAIGQSCLARMTALQSSRLQLLGAALDQSTDLVIVTPATPSPTTHRREMLYVNQALLRHSGYTLQEVIGRAPDMFQGPETDPAAVARMSAQLAQFQPVNETLINYKKDGTPYINELHITPFFNPGGQATHFLSVQRDVTQQHALSTAIQQKNGFLENLTENLPAAIYVLRRSADGEYNFDFATSTYYRFFGLPADTSNRTDVLNAMHPDDVQRVIESTERAFRTGGDWRQRFRAIDQQSGKIRILEGRSSLVTSPTGESRSFGLMLDVTDQAEMEDALNEALRDQDATLAAIPEKLLEVSADGTVLRAHLRGRLLMGLEVETVLNRRLSDVFKRGIAHPFMQAIDEATVAGISSRHEIYFVQEGRREYRSLLMVRKDGGADAAGRALPFTFVASISDITRTKQAEKRIRFLVEHDELTHLLNRRGFQERLNRVHRLMHATGRCYALIFIDLDHFKHLNDSHGHLAGDVALQEVAMRIRDVVSVKHIVARVGGDEFVILLIGPNPEATQEEASRLAHQIHAAIQRPLRLQGLADGLLFSLTCSIGIALADASATNGDDILRWADMAMYSIKEDGRNGVRFFSEAVHQSIVDRIHLEQALHHALERSELQIHGQPIVDRNGDLLGQECLLRWHKAHQNWVSPADFIPIAEQSGQILAIGDWVLQQACQTLQRWQQEPRLQRCYLAVNVSCAQIKQPDFVERVACLLERYQIGRGLLKLEMTESLLQDDVEGAIVKLEQLRTMGVTISLDDFGTGYSSLAYLLRLPIDELKMDRSFLLNALDQPKSATLARLIVQTAQTLGLNVIAEGVETDEQFRFLLGLGCERFQGYMFGRPALLV